MSTFADVSLRCASCGRLVRARLALSLAANRALAWAAQARDGGLHRIRCEGCGATHRAESRFAYTDFARACHIDVVPPSARPAWRAELARARSAFAMAFVHLDRTAARALRDTTKCRLVFGLRALREKLLLWDYGYDDRLVEAAKARLLTARFGSHPSAELWLAAVTSSGGLCYRAMLPKRGDSVAAIPGPWLLLRPHDLQDPSRGLETPDPWLVDAAVLHRFEGERRHPHDA